MRAAIFILGSVLFTCARRTVGFVTARVDYLYSILLLYVCLDNTITW